ncbi:MAG: type II secretion system protein [bacterium JZ-2024 1]
MGTLSRKGFTLIEMLVVITILGILITLAVPNFMKARDKAFEAQVKAGANDIRLAVEQFSSDENGYYPGYIWGGSVRSWCVDITIGDMGNACSERSKTSVKSLPPNQRRQVLDPLIRHGYLARYPRNPFIKSNSSLCVATRYDPRFNCIPPPNYNPAGSNPPGKEDVSTMANVLPDPNFANSGFADVSRLGYNNRFRAYFVGDASPDTLDWIPGEFFYRSWRSRQPLPWCHPAPPVYPPPPAGQENLNQPDCESEARAEFYVLGVYGSPRTAGQDLLCDPLPNGNPNQSTCMVGSVRWTDSWYGHPTYPSGLPNVALRDNLDPDADGNINSDDCNGDGQVGGFADCDLNEGLQGGRGPSFGEKVKMVRPEFGVPDNRLDGLLIVFSSHER